ncbi:MAG: hypothetical protein ABEJ05_12185 [Haloglomus sp.]
MEVHCPYCRERVDITQLADHVRLRDDESHGPHDTTPVDHLDNPWNLRVDVADDAAESDRDPQAPDVEYVGDEVRRGRCPACERGTVALKGGDGFLSSGPRRLACPNCGWESPEWISISE